jgi:putative redox protein
MRFDFTGLGESEGKFSDTNFSGNIQDLISASEFLSNEYKAPSLIIGHSLGGAAALIAASEIDSVKAIATIGAPSNPVHVEHLFIDKKQKIEKEGIAEVSIGGRPFIIKKQFIEDLKKKNPKMVLSKMRKALLIGHSPQDQIVDITNAADLYNAAHHPKSFISLDKADHLLTESTDSLYIGDVIARWAIRYLNVPKPKSLDSRQQVVAKIGDEKYTTLVKAGSHYLTADEPENSGGNGFGPTPYDLLMASLGACTAMTLKMYSERKKWPLNEVTVHLKYESIHDEDCKVCDTENRKLERFTREIEISGDLDVQQRSKLLQIADKCPVHRTLSSNIQIETKLVD